MTTEALLQHLDPARDLEPDADSLPARTMLARIVDTSRVAPAARERRRKSGRRVALGAVLAGAAATVALAAPMPWDSGAGTSASAFAVTPRSNGDIDVTIDYRDLNDTAALQARLDAAGAPMMVRSGRHCPVGGPGTIPATRDEVEAPGLLAVGAPDAHIPVFILHPDAFPAGATFVVTVIPAENPTPGANYDAISWEMVRGPVPSCGS